MSKSELARIVYNQGVLDEKLDFILRVLEHHDPEAVRKVNEQKRNELAAEGLLGDFHD